MLASLTPLTHFEYLLVAAIVLFLPGLAWQAWLPADERDPLEHLADSLGISVGLTTLIGLAGFLLKIQFSAMGVVGLYGLCLFIWAGGLLRPGRFARIDWRAIALALGGIALLVGALAWRLYQARDLLLPAWVDSVHHVLVVKLIEQNGGLPATYAPYFPSDFTYHYGFHLLAALFSGLTRAPAELGTLWFGQAINAVVALSVYRLGRAAWRDRRAAAVAALLVAFVFQMPAYYVSWGRDTLLTGLAVLPAAMAAALELTRAPQRRSLAVRLGLLTAGVALSHYTTLLLLLLFLIILGLGLLLRRDWRALRTTAIASLAGALLAAPWLWRSWRALSYQAGLEVVSPLGSDQSGYGQYLLYLIGPNYNYWLYGLALAALVWLLLRGEKTTDGLASPVGAFSARALPLWGLVIGLLMLPWGLRISPFRPDHMAILAFLPASLLLGGGLARLSDRLASLHLAARWGRAGGWLTRAGRLLAPLAVLGLLTLGLLRTRSVLNPSTVFIDAADMHAIDWVQANTPRDGRFFINTTGWQGLYRGVDGGYWLLTLTGRQTVTPPALAWMGTADDREELNAQAGLASQAAACDDTFWQVVDQAGLTYAYIKQGVGALQPEALVNCAGVLNVYRRDGVFIYEIAR